MSSYYSTSTYSAQPYKFPYRSSYGFIVIAIILLMMSWESQKTDAAMTAGSIPEEAIRLRILAHSDSPADQLVKRVVRDAIVKQMGSYTAQPATIEEARAVMQEHMPEMEETVAQVLRSRGFSYSFSVQLNNVQFPTKMYGNEVYPAGEYEALLITLGEGNGQNWWCVLFPPLCFVDAATGEASAASASADASVVTVSAAQDADKQSAAAGEAPEVKFFLWEMIQKLMDWIKSLF